MSRLRVIPPSEPPAPARVVDFPPRKPGAERFSTIPERIAVYVEVLRGIPPTGPGGTFTPSDRGRIFSKTMIEINALKNDYALRTTRGALTDYRKAVRFEFGVETLADGSVKEHPAIVYLKSFRKDLEAINSADRAKVFAQHQQQKPIDPDDFIERALGQLDSQNYGQRVAALLLLTGRRTVEICHTGTFTQIPGRPDVVIFAGQAKTKKKVPKPPYEIPLLADAEEIVASIAVVRSRRTFIDEEDTDSKIGKDVNDASRRIFGNYTPHELRKVYATIAYEDYKSTRPTPRLSVSAYFAKILGHVDGDITTAQSYTGAFYIEGRFDEARADQRESAKDILAVLEARREVADERIRAFIDVDIAKARALAADDLAAPAVTAADQTVVDGLNGPQRALLGAVLGGLSTFGTSARMTIAALQRRGLVSIAYDKDDRFALPKVVLTSRGTEIAAILERASSSSTEI